MSQRLLLDSTENVKRGSGAATYACQILSRVPWHLQYILFLVVLYLVFTAHG